MSTSTAAYPAILKKPPAAAMLPLLLVFICGIAVGALAMSWKHHGPSPSDTWNKVTVLQWTKELNLSEHQKHELETILDDFAKYYDNVLADGKDRILSILDDGQKRKFERMLQERHKP